MITRARIYEIMDIASSDDTASRTFDILFLVLIISNIFALMLETVDSLYTNYKHIFDAVEYTAVVLFSIEILLRIWTAPENPRVHGERYPRLKLFVTPLFVIDLIAIIPFYLSFLGIDLRFLRIIRLGKIFRYSKSLQLFGRVFVNQREDLILSIIVMSVLLVIASSGIYFAERDAQPGTFSSIPAAMWWALATLTTIGYGDIYPITVIGKLFAGIVALAGIGMVALPTGIISAGFVEEVKSQRSGNTCPNCGINLNE